MGVKYDYLVIDAQYFLTRNYFAIRGSGSNKLPDTSYATIASSVIRSIIKVFEEVPSKKVILLWDTYPYYKHTLLEDYKGTRSYTTDEDVEAEEDPEIKAQLEIDAHNLKQRGLAKRLLKELNSFGLPSFFKSGYEADDLAYVVSNKIKELSKTGCLVSIDSDWTYWINESVDVLNPKKMEITTHKDMVDYLELEHPLSLFEYKQLYDSFYGSHNDYIQTVTDDNWSYSFNEFYQLYLDTKDKSTLFKDYDRFKLQYHGLSILEYPEFNKVQSMMYYLDKTGGIPSKSQWEEFRTEKLLSVTVDELDKIISKLDINLYYD